MRVLVFGETGQVARELLRAAEARGIAIEALGRARADLADAAAVTRAVTDAEADAVINAAAYTAVDRAESEPDLAHAVNAGGPGAMAAACALRGLPFLHISTDYVFDGRPGRPWREDDRPDPVSVYGRSKLEGEAAVEAAMGAGSGTPPSAEALSTTAAVAGADAAAATLGADAAAGAAGMAAAAAAVDAAAAGGGAHASVRGGEANTAAAGGRYAILRTGWVFSAHGANFVKTMLRVGAERPELRIVEDQVGGPTPARAIADALLTMADAFHAGRGTSGIFHFGGTPALSWADFAAEIFATRARTHGSRIPRIVRIPSSDYPVPARRPANSVLDCTKIRGAFGIEPPDWRVGLAEVLEELP